VVLRLVLGCVRVDPHAADRVLHQMIAGRIMTHVTMIAMFVPSLCVVIGMMIRSAARSGRLWPIVALLGLEVLVIGHYGLL
jgi:hypothetical protein